MKSFAIALTILASLSLLVVPSESALNDDEIVESLPNEVFKTLIDSPDLVNYSINQPYPPTNFTFNVSISNNITVNSTVTPLGPTLFHVVFDLIIPDVNVEGNLTIKGKQEGTIRWAVYGATGTGNLTITFESFLNIRTVSLVVKNNLKHHLSFSTDFIWDNCEPVEYDCIQAESQVRNYLATKFLYEYNDRIHEVLYKASPDIAQKVVESKDNFGRGNWN